MSRRRSWLHAFAAFLSPWRPGGLDWLHLLLILGLSFSLGVSSGIVGTITAEHVSASFFAHRYQANVSVPRARSAVPILPRGIMPAAAAITMAGYPAVMDQGPLGSCASSATSQVLTLLWRRAHPHSHLHFSARYLYSAFATRYDGGKDGGSDPARAAAVAETTGIPAWSKLPYPPYVIDRSFPPAVLDNAAKHRFTVSSQDLSNAMGGGIGAVDAIKQAIVQNQPALLAAPVFPEFDNATQTQGLIGAPQPGERDRGGHEFVGIAYNDTLRMPDGTSGAVEIRNTWSARWGLQGDAWLSYAYIERWAFGITVLSVGQPTAAYVPPGSIFGLTNLTGFVSSAYWYEAGILGGSPAVADSDYLLGFAVHEMVTLPGGHGWTYRLLQTGDVPGSGWYETFLTPRYGGRIASLHLTSLAWLQGRTVFHGGDVIGQSGWPSSTTYSNGSCSDATSCERDAHLCEVYDQAGARWLWYVVHHPNPPRHHKPFSVAAWNAYRAAHHTSVISPFVKGRLTPIAHAWWFSRGVAKRCGAVAQPARWHRKHAVTSQRFRRCEAWHWTGRWVKWQPVKA